MNSIKFLLGFALVAIASAAPGDEKCRGACPRDYDPICAKDNTGNLKIFGNKCVFDFEACENRAENWRQTGLQECNSLRNGQSQQQQGGQSQQQQGGQQGQQSQQHQGGQQQTGEQCRFACPLNWQPICAQDNTGNIQVFGNECALDAAACENRAANWRAVPINVCSSLLN